MQSNGFSEKKDAKNIKIDKITCLDFGMMMNALLEVLLSRELFYFSFKFNHLLLMIYVLRL